LAQQDFIKLSRESFVRLFLQQENLDYILTQRGRRIETPRIIPEEWKIYRIYDYEKAINENKKHILLVDQKYVSRVEKEFREKIRI
jgi:hypothetical protein